MRVHIHADNGADIGFGHLGRCRRLATALQARGMECHFLGVRPESRGFLDGFAVTAEDVPAACDVAVVDSYHMDDGTLEALRRLSRVLVVIDDFADRPVACDVLVNHNIYAERLDYARYDVRHLLLGPAHALIDPELESASAARPEADVVMTFGLSDLAGLLLSIAPEVARATDARVVAVVPSRLTAGRQVAGDSAQAAVDIVDFMPTARLFARGDVLVTGLGVTYLEALATGRRVLGVRLADNQTRNYEHARELGLPVVPEPDATRIVQGVRELLVMKEAEWASLCPRVDPNGSARVASIIADMASRRR